ncbi:MAG TPA: MBL fold metallo-hydrolase [Verrucomicrobiae bacterium]|nr:MBL fold metallo-hydrolase [Verrucomicrobiae bacterium]
MKIQEIGEKIFRIEVPVPVNIETVNVYLFTGRVPTLLDCGTNTRGCLRDIRKALQDLGVRELSQVLLTHSHVDHAGGARELARDGAKVYLSEVEFRDWVSFTDAQGIENTHGKIYREWGVPEGEVPGILDIYHKLLSLTTSPPEVSFIEPTRQIPAGDYVLQAIPTPGHTPGHLAFYLDSFGLLFSGDQLLPEQVPFPGAWLEEGRIVSGLPHYIDSLTTLEQLQAHAYFPSHGEPRENPSRRCREVREIIYRQARSYSPRETVYRGATAGRPAGANPGKLFLKLHNVFGWETLQQA